VVNEIPRHAVVGVLPRILKILVQAAENLLCGIEIGGTYLQDILSYDPIQSFGKNVSLRNFVTHIKNEQGSPLPISLFSRFLRIVRSLF
jgi:hypothetical protein